MSLPTSSLARNRDGSWSIRAGKQNFVLRGAAGSYDEASLRLLKKWGGTTIRTYEPTGLSATLDLAQSLGFKVIVGLGLSAKRMSQPDVDKAVKTVEQFKTHPAVLMWSLGNEIELCDDLDATFKLLEQTAALVRKADPGRVITNVFVDFGSDPKAPVRKYLREIRCLDCLGFNTYQGAATLAERYADLGIDVPFFAGELGWMPAFLGRFTTWDKTATHEKSSTDKARHYELALASLKNCPSCLGAIVFRWGMQTSAVGGASYPSETWHCMFLPGTLEKTEIGDVLLRIWTGKAPSKKAPVISSKTVYEYAGATKTYVEAAWTGISKVPQTCRVERGDIVSARCVAESCDDGPLTYAWELRYHNEVAKHEWPPCKRASACPTTFWNTWGPTKKKTSTYVTKNTDVFFTAPEAGTYRLHVTVKDTHGNAAYASWPFRSDPPKK